MSIFDRLIRSTLKQEFGNGQVSLPGRIVQGSKPMFVLDINIDARFQLSFYLFYLSPPCCMMDRFIPRRGGNIKTLPFSLIFQWTYFMWSLTIIIFYRWIRPLTQQKFKGLAFVPAK